MQCWQHLWRASCDDLLPQLVLPTLERTQLPHQRTAAASVGDEGLDEFRRQEAILQSHKHPRQYLVAEYGAAIGAGGPLAMIGASAG